MLAENDISLMAISVLTDLVPVDICLSTAAVVRLVGVCLQIRPVGSSGDAVCMGVA